MSQKYCIHCMSPMEGDICGVCGKRTDEYQAAPHHLQPGSILGGKYIVGAVLGEGGFGITYIGRETTLDIKVAIKEYYPSGAVNRNNTCSSEITAHVGDAAAYFEKGKNSFLGEARTLAKFASEPSVVSVRDFFSENNTAYIVMEYLEGIDLKDHLKQNGKMSFEDTVRMLTPVMKALSKIHAQGLIHRDISPANIMILKDGTVKLLDFGAAREVGGADEKSLSILLKPGFAPEEQYRTKGHQGPWTDVYALSATMYKMMTGINPSDAMNRVFQDDLARISEYNPAVTPAQEAVIYKGMAVHQSNRYQSVDELCAACHNACSCVSAYAEEKTLPCLPAEAGPAPQYQAAYSQPAVQPSPNAYNGAGRGDSLTACAAQPRGGYAPIQSREQPQAPYTAGASGTAVKDDSVKGSKKPNKLAFAGSVFSGALTMYMLLICINGIIGEKFNIFTALFTSLFAGLTFLLGRLYFPRIDNKKRKPNIFCLSASIVSSLFTLFFGALAYTAFTDPWAEKGDGALFVAMTLLSLVLPIFFGYFFYPRLNKKKKSLAVKIYGGIGAAAVIALVIGIIITSLTTVSIGDQKVKRNATKVRVSFDVLTNQDVEKLKELKNLEQLIILECFLDDEDVKIIGELTRLKYLSVELNTDITDISPLSNLKELAYLDVSNTKVSDISCIGNLTKLQTLNVSNTAVTDLSVLRSFTSLETLKMNSIEGLDMSTAVLPASVRTLECKSNGLTSLEFVTGSESLSNLYADNNAISDLSPLSKYKINMLSLSANKITDLTPLNIKSLTDIDLSTNMIEDISHLKGTVAYMVDLSYNRISDIGAFADNAKIGSLKLKNNQIEDISPLKDCFNLFFLDLSYNRIEDIGALATIDELSDLDLRSNKIADISPLAACTKLKENKNSLDLRDNCIKNIDALSGYINTRHIYLSNNQITDVSPLAGCAALELLKLSGNLIEDISPLASLKNLKILELVNNPITNVGLLAVRGEGSGFLERAIIRISYNEQIDFEALSSLENVQISVYGVPPRKQRAMSDSGFIVFGEYDGSLDEIEPNDDLEEDASEGTDTDTEADMAVPSEKDTAADTAETITSAESIGAAA